MSTKNSTTNGVVKSLTPTGSNSTKPELSNLVVNAPSQEKPASEKPKDEKTKEESKKEMAPIQNRLKKLDELNQLLERRKLLVEALDDVNAFVISPNSTCSIRFVDAKNNAFSVSNQLVIADMVELAKARLTSELEKVDAKIVF
jgi:hypothetical protein